MLQLISSFFSAIGSVFGYVKTVQDEKNTAAVVAAKTSTDNVKADDADKKLVDGAAGGSAISLKEIQKELGE